MTSPAEISNNISEGTAKIPPSLWALFIVSFLSNVMGGAVSTLMAVYLPEVAKDLVGKSNPGFVNEISAYINALYLLGWTIGGFTWGLISDQIGRTKSFLISLALFGLFTLLISFVSTWETVVALRLLTGFCVGGVLVITNTYLSEVWPVKTRAIFLGFLSIGFPVGIISSGIINYIFHSWRTGFSIGLLPIGIALLSIGLIREVKKENANDLKTDYRLKQVFNDNHEKLIKGSIIFGSMLIGLWAVFSWLPTWVQSLLENTDGQKQRSLCMMLMGLGGLTGGFFSGWIARGVGLRKSMMLCFAGCLILSCILFGFNRTFSQIIYVEVAMLAVFFGISQGLLSAYIPQLFAPVLRGTATGFCFNTGRIFTTVAVFFVGALVSIFGGYSNALLSFSIVFLIGLITIYFSTDIKLKT